MTTEQTGSYLAALREEAGFKQNELAAKIGWSAAMLSRIESGERSTSPDELEVILDAIGTRKALGFREILRREWHVLQRPPFGHPDEQLLWDAERALQGISELIENADVIRPAFLYRLSDHEVAIEDTAKLVTRREHSIAFVGDIGVGKTTAICRATGLMVEDAEKVSLIPMLEVGAGGVTVCDVHVATGPEYGIRIEPMGENEIQREVREFANFLKSLGETTQGVDLQDPDPSDFNGTTKELERAIRNMSDLTVKRLRGPDGRWIGTTDPAKELAESSPDMDTLAMEILVKMNLKARTKRELWYSSSVGVNPMVWLAETFKDINNGRRSEFSIPKRIDVMLPRPILGEDFLSIRMVDTRGIDRTAQRADIEAHIVDPHTAVVLCSNFNSAPSTSVQQLIERAIAGRLSNHLSEKISVLVLPKHDEALAVKDDAGYPVENREDGYQLKGEQAQMRLSNIAPDIGIYFFDAVNDGRQEFQAVLLKSVTNLRAKYCEELKELITDANEMVANYENEQVRVVQQQAAQRLNTWLRSAQPAAALTNQLADGFLAELGSAHPSSLRASVRRQGDWYNFDYPYRLGSLARVMADRALGSKMQDFKAIAKNLLDDPDLEDAHGLVRAADRIMASGAESLRQVAQQWGTQIHSHHMEHDQNLWDESEAEWGQGPGYRARVSNHHEDWFEERVEALRDVAQLHFRRVWNQTRDRLEKLLEVD